MGFCCFDYVFTRFASHERTSKMDFRSPPCKSQESWLEKHEHERPCRKATFFWTSKPSLFLIFQLIVCPLSYVISIVFLIFYDCSGRRRGCGIYYSRTTSLYQPSWNLFVAGVLGRKTGMMGGRGRFSKWLVGSILYNLSCWHFRLTRCPVAPPLNLLGSCWRQR